MALLVLEFILCAGVIVWCGALLSKYGDIIAEKAGLGRAWIGLVLMATVTSLPELVNGISSVTLADVPDIALGDVMGSCIYNLSLIAVIDVFHRPGPILGRGGGAHVLSSGFGVMLISLSAASILLSGNFPGVFHVGFYTPAIIFIYLVSIRTIYLFERERIAEFVEETRYDHITGGQAALRYALNAAVIIAAATALPFLGERLALVTGLGTSFVGGAFIGLTTSLPELVISIAAVRIGAADLAMANLLGSNLFNILVVAVDDLFYTKGPLLADVSQVHALSAFMALVGTGIVIVALAYRRMRKTFLRISWDTAALLVNLAAALLLMYAMR